LSFWDWFESVVEWIRENLIDPIWDFIHDRVEPAIRDLRDRIDSAVDSLRQRISDALNSAKEFAENLVSEARSALEKLIQDAREIAGKAWSWIQDTGKWLKDSLSWLKQQLHDFIQDPVGYIKNAVKPLFKPVYDKIRDFKQWVEESLSSAKGDLEKRLEEFKQSAGKEFGKLWEKVNDGWRYLTEELPAQMTATAATAVINFVLDLLLIEVDYESFKPFQQFTSRAAEILTEEAVERREVEVT